jgi:DNA helicase-2/ATP-dependent DNA helicase PcrA
MRPSLIGYLNDVQQQAVMATQGPVLILAGAGSGKTRVLTHRIAYLIAEQDVSPFHILAVTFTNKAANEMKERIEQLVGSQAKSIWMGTFHSVFSRILRMEYGKIGIPQNYTIYDSDDQRALIKTCMTELQISTELYAVPLIQSRISYAKNHLLSPVQFQKSMDNPVDEKAQKIYAEYEKRLSRNNALDFDDLISKPIFLFSEYPDVLEFYQDKFRYIHVDEYQDTNHAQYRLIHMLSRKHLNICVVGDDDQSIYGWRHADISNILNFTKEFTNTQVFKLEQNYRSTKNILDVAGKVVLHNQMRTKKILWTDNQQGEPVVVIENETDRNEAKTVVETIQRLMRKEKREFSDFAILYRTNAQSRILEDALRSAVIPYVIVGGLRFYERKEIKDVLAYLRVINNPSDDVSLKRIINFPVRGIGLTSIERIADYAKELTVSMYEAIKRIVSQSDSELQPKAQNSLVEFYTMIEKYRDLKKTIDMNEWLGILLDEIGIMKYYKKEQTMEGMERYENIAELINAVHEFSQKYDSDSSSDMLESFLNDVTLMMDIDQWDDKKIAVTLMTLHSSKGLEFPVVFIVGAEDGLFPMEKATHDKKELEEERRLFYVGATRAQEKLFILYAKQRMRFNNLYLCLPSRFLDELPDESVEWIRTNRKTVKEKYADYRPEQKQDYKPKSGKVKYLKDISPQQQSSDDSIRRDFLAGQQVQHPTFGRGKIISVEGSGDSQKLKVLFKDGIERKLFVKYANLSVH